MPSAPDFNDIVAAIEEQLKRNYQGGELLSSRTAEYDRHPPAYAAHVTLDGKEYLIIVQPTDM